MGSSQKAGSENWGATGEIVALYLRVCSVLPPSMLGVGGGMVWAKPVWGISKLLNFPYSCITEYHRSGNFCAMKLFIINIMANFHVYFVGMILYYISISNAHAFSFS